MKACALALALVLAGVSLDALKKDLDTAIKAADPRKVADCVANIGAVNTREAAEFIHLKVLGQVDLFRFRQKEYEKWPLPVPPEGDMAAQERMEKAMEARRADAASVTLIFETAKAALLGMSDPKAVAYVFEAAERPAKDLAARIAIVEVVASLAGGEAEAVLVRLVQDKAEAVARIAVQRLGDRRSVKGVPAIMDLLERVEQGRGDVWAACLDALTAVTGEEFATAKEWRSFWEIKGKGFDPEKDRGGKTGGGTVVQGAPDFFGTEVISKKIVFLIDVSQSMHTRDPVVGGEADDGNVGGGGQSDPKRTCPVPGCDQTCHPDLPIGRERLYRVKRELTRLIDVLSPDTQFNVIAFSKGLKSWQQRTLVVANAANKESARKFVEAFQPDSFTSTDYVLDEAFEDKDATAFYLLSDGAPFRGNAPLPLEPIYEGVRVRNKTRHVKIHTICMPGGKEAFMQQIAGMTGGKYAVVR